MPDITITTSREFAPEGTNDTRRISAPMTRFNGPGISEGLQNNGAPDAGHNVPGNSKPLCELTLERLDGLIADKYIRIT